MKKILLIVCLCFFIFACDNESGGNPVAPEMAQRTVLAYLIGNNGSNDLSNFLKNDFLEMCEGMSDVDDTKNKLLVYSQSIDNMPYLIHIKKNKGRVIADTIIKYGNQNPLQKNVMTEVIQYVVKKYPAQDYGLILASHGEGWIQGSSSTRWFGDYEGYYMNIADINDVLSKFPRFNFILFDACYMQAIEVAYQLKNCTDYIISSPTEIPGPGAPYQKVIPAAFANKSNIGVDVGAAYYDYYDNMFEKSNVEWSLGVSISVIKSSELDELASITQSILPQYVGNKEIIDTSSLLYYDREYTRYYYDFNQLMAQVTDENDHYNIWRTAFDNAQPYFKTTRTNYARGKLNNGSLGRFDMSGSSGMAIYIPRNNATLNSFYHTLDWYKVGGWKEIGW